MQVGSHVLKQAKSCVRKGECLYLTLSCVCVRVCLCMHEENVSCICQHLDRIETMQQSGESLVMTLGNGFYATLQIALLA